MTDPFHWIDKPTLLLDEETARRNIRRMAERARQLDVRFRPHFKTHQSAAVGEWFREEGVAAITTSSVDMAAYFARHGWNDITIAFPANLRQTESIAELADSSRLGLLIESSETVRKMDEAVRSKADAWIKIDVGAGRTGLPWNAVEPAAQVVEAVQRTRRLRLRGLLTHAGHNYAARGTEEVCQRAFESAARIDGLRRALEQQGSGPLEVSVGDTPSSSLCDNLGPVDEIRPGNFVFYDAQQIQIGSCTWQDVAVALACPVVAHHPERSQIVVYGGAVHLSKDYFIEDDQRKYGLVCLPDDGRWGEPLPGAYVASVSQEHGILNVPPEYFDRMPVGGLAFILPAHSCLTVTLMQRYRTLAGAWIDTLNA